LIISLLQKRFLIYRVAPFL